MKRKNLFVLITAIGLLAACKGKPGNIELAKSYSLSADSTKAENDIVDKNVAEKLVKTADINFKVKNVRQVGEDIALLTNQFGGMVMHHQVQSTASSTRDVHISNDSVMRISAYNTTAEMTIRVPSDKLEDFISKVSHMAIYVNMSKMDIDDRTLDYLSNQLKLEDREELSAQQKSGKVVIKKLSDVLDLKDDVVDKKIGNRATDEAVKFSIVNLNFYQDDAILKEIVANNDPSDYNVPFPQRLGLALASGWSLFIDIVVALANLWMFIVVGLVTWRMIIYYKKRIRPGNLPAK
ncbi:MAG TPA: DUF4349 domain-containing protein [Mucilaginibacter sp.]|nr:DUF4349 domain-containing protein [Mucilaginibacter sp.]